MCPSVSSVHIVNSDFLVYVHMDTDMLSDSHHTKIGALTMCPYIF